MKLKIVLCLLLLLSLSFSPQLFPKVHSVDKIAELDRQKKELEKRKEDLESKIARDNQLIKELTYSENTLSEELNQLEVTLQQTGQELELMKVEEELFRVQYVRSLEESQILRSSIELKEKRSNELIVTLYKNYMLNYTAYLLSSKSINEIIDNSLFLQYLFEADKHYFIKLKQEKAQLEDNKLKEIVLQENLYQKKSEKEKKEEELTLLAKDKVTQINEITHRKQITAAGREQDLRQYDAIEAQIREVIRLRAEEILRQKVSMTPMGPVIWPLAGYVSSPFGMRMHPIFGVNRMHTGIDIDAPLGSPIVSAAEGVVAFSGWLGGYGNTVIVQHDQVHTTLYAHLNSLPVDKDQDLEQGEILGYVGMTGWTTGPHLHFEIRKNGDPVNPASYLP
jgi:murein DD-endopeptidase MepM/ murein hydrolase activator NlpD